MRRRYIFRGQVQGVGFRFHAENAARGLGVTGWVRNNPDGTVEMEAQADEELLDKMIAYIRGGRYIEIDSTEVTEIPERTDESAFRVRMF